MRAGIYYTRQWRGLTVLSSWPRRRKARRTQLQLRREYDFASVVLATKWMDPTLIRAVKSQLDGSEILWRDLLTAQVYGTAFYIETEEGKTLVPRQFYEKVSRALDLLGAETGAILVRDIGMWQTLPPGNAGQVLTSNGPGLMPGWN